MTDKPSHGADQHDHYAEWCAKYAKLADLITLGRANVEAARARVIGQHVGRGKRMTRAISKIDVLQRHAIRRTGRKGSLEYRGGVANHAAPPRL